VIQVEHLSLRAGAFRLTDLTFAVPSGGYTVLMGRTGSGKTTLLETLCGLKPATTGVILLAGRDVTRLPPALRGIGYVPQDRALFQTMTVREHLAFAPRLRRWPRARIGERIAELAGLLGIGPLLDRKPAGLSGGEAQRVALGRALAAQPAVLCLDEPLSALDDQTREEMVDLLKMVRQQTGVTTLHVTHHLQEAQRLADQVLELREGRLQSKVGGCPSDAPTR
jgi:molybdate/tungstate transport system ATP-binding protein